MKTSKLKNNNIKQAYFLTQIIGVLPSITNHHRPSDQLYSLLKDIASKEAISLFSHDENIVEFIPFGQISFPYFKMGNIDSVNLFNFDEIIIFSFYYQNKNLYKNILDIGGNIGLHSIIAGKVGFNVTTYEPDEIHYNVLSSNIEKNGLSENVKLVRAAVSNAKGKASFTRVLDNTTGSHLTLSKKNPYGPLDEIIVDKEDVLDIIQHNKIDLMKIDAEGHECQILSRIPTQHWSDCDAIVEVGTAENAEKIFNLFDNTNINLFSQKNGWNRVLTLSDMPTSHRDGSLFISIKVQMPWGE